MENIVKPYLRATLYNYFDIKSSYSMIMGRTLLYDIKICLRKLLYICTHTSIPVNIFVPAAIQIQYFKAHITQILIFYDPRFRYDSYLSFKSSASVPLYRGDNPRITTDTDPASARKIIGVAVGARLHSARVAKTKPYEQHSHSHLRVRIYTRNKIEVYRIASSTSFIFIRPRTFSAPSTFKRAVSEGSRSGSATVAPPLNLKRCHYHQYLNFMLWAPQKGLARYEL